MRTQSSDTHPKAERFQIGLIGHASVAERISRVRSLSKTVVWLSRRAISRANPALSDEQVSLVFVAHHYGNDLADRLREYLKQRAL